ncbi:hypothetical protein C8Q77DRAFT_475242 [Trametes polyzona]|nr:hypothetical protein C8Q77DRAFT_475242 [Trametes polyzona]
MQRATHLVYPCRAFQSTPSVSSTGEFEAPAAHPTFASGSPSSSTRVAPSLSALAGDPGVLVPCRARPRESVHVGMQRAAVVRTGSRGSSHCGVPMGRRPAKMVSASPRGTLHHQGGVVSTGPESSGCPRLRLGESYRSAPSSRDVAASLPVPRIWSAPRSVRGGHANEENIA